MSNSSIGVARGKLPVPVSHEPIARTLHGSPTSDVQVDPGFLVGSLGRLVGLLFERSSSVDAEAVARVRTRLLPNAGTSQLDNLGPAQLTSLAAEYCKPQRPLCSDCPVSLFCATGRKVVDRPSPALPFIDLFSGAGGLSLGLEAAGWVPVLAVDKDVAACQTYAFNRPWLPPTDTKASSISDLLATSALPKAPLIVGGPPCQGFSNANRQRLSADPRNVLYREFLTALSMSEASLALLENVPAMYRATSRLIGDFSDIGYQVHPLILNSRDFRHPQNRRRLFLLCVRTMDVFQFARIVQEFTDSLNQLGALFSREQTLRDAIGDLPALKAKTVQNNSALENDEFGYTVSLNPKYQHSEWSELINGGDHPPVLFNHRTKFNNARDIEIYGRLQPGQNSTSDTIKDLMPYKRRKDIFKDKFFKLQFDRPSKTITAHMYYDCHMYIHPEQARGLTPREAARIQGFPDDYLFLGYPNEWYRQIGNAVSPPVALAIGEALRHVAETEALL